MPRCRDRYRRRKRIAKRHAQLEAEARFSAFVPTLRGIPIARIAEAFNIWTQTIERVWEVTFPILFRLKAKRCHVAETTTAGGNASPVNTLSSAAAAHASAVELEQLAGAPPA